MADGGGAGVRLQFAHIHHSTVQNIALAYRSVIGIRHLAFDVVDVLYTLYNFAEHDMFAVQMRCGLCGDEEL